jgi:hypothetical protein
VAVAFDVAVGQLRRGDAAPLAAMLDAGALATWDLLRAWHEVSTLAGQVVQVVVLTDGRHRWAAALEPAPPRSAGGPPITVVDGAATARAIAAQLDSLGSGFGLDAHGQAAHASWRALGAGALAPERVDPTAAMLAHHGDGPLGVLDGRQAVPSDRAAQAAAALAPACEPLGDARLIPHLHAGLASPSRPRRLLSFCLLRRAGLADGHPDDMMSM